MLKIGRLVVETAQQIEGAPFMDDAVVNLHRSDGVEVRCEGKAFVWPWLLRHSERWHTAKPHAALCITWVKRAFRA